MSLDSTILEYIQAAFSGIWVHTYEDPVALLELRKLCVRRNFLLVIYDIAEGVGGSVDLIGDGANVPPSKYYEERKAAWQKSPTTFLRDVPSILPAVNQERAERDDNSPVLQRAVVVLRNGHFDVLLRSELHIQLLQGLLQQGKSHDFHIVITSPKIAIPLELERNFVVVEHPLPCRETLKDLAVEICETPEDSPSTEEEWASLLEAAAGLTTYEAENAYSLSLIREQKLDVATVWDVKAQTVKKRGLLEIYQGDDSFDNLGGMKAFKDFTVGLLNSRQPDPRLRPKGVLLLGVPGSGKSVAVRCLGNAVGRRVLSLDLGRIRSKFQGESENNLLDAIRIADSMQPCILFVD